MPFNILVFEKNANGVFKKNKKRFCGSVSVHAADENRGRFPHSFLHRSGCMLESYNKKEFFEIIRE